METNFEYLIQILRDPSLDTWTLEEQQEINNLDLSQGLHTFLYDAYTGIITYQPNKLKMGFIGYYIPIRPYNNPRLRQYYLPRLIYLTQGLTKVPGFLLTLI